MPFPCPVNVTDNLRPSFGLKGCYSPAVARACCVYSQSAPQTLNPSLVCTAGRCHVFLKTITQTFCYLSFYFNQISRLFFSFSGIRPRTIATMRTALRARAFMIRDDGVTQVPTVTVSPAEEMDVQMLCQLKYFSM